MIPGVSMNDEWDVKPSQKRKLPSHMPYKSGYFLYCEYLANGALSSHVLFSPTQNRPISKDFPASIPKLTSLHNPPISPTVPRGFPLFALPHIIAMEFNIISWIFKHLTGKCLLYHFVSDLFPPWTNNPRELRASVLASSRHDFFSLIALKKSFMHSCFSLLLFFQFLSFLCFPDLLFNIRFH